MMGGFCEARLSRSILVDKSGYMVGNEGYGCGREFVPEVKMALGDC